MSIRAALFDVCIAPSVNARPARGIARAVILPCVASLMFVCGCEPSRPPPPPHGNATAPPPPAKTHAAAALADLENARFALSRMDRTAANNDLLRAIEASQRLPDETQTLFVAPAAGQRGPKRLAPFALRAGLIDARAALLSGDLAAADRILAGLSEEVPAAVVPPRLPLVQARESLALAEKAAKDGQRSELGTELQNAESVLRTYAATSHAQAPRLLADEIAAYAGSPARLATLSPVQAQVWAAKVQL